MTATLAPTLASAPDNQVIVIGGGLAGLAAATYLARGGASVTLLEKSATPGGRARTDTPAGFALNRGIHALYTGGPASEVMRELNVTYASGRPSHVFARDAAGLHPFPATARDLVVTDLLDAADKLELMRILVQVGMLPPASLAERSAADWIASVTRRPRLRKVLQALATVNLYSSALDLASADTFLARLQQTLKHPIHYLDGGWQPLVDACQRVARDAGVRIETSADARAVIVHDGSARGVRLASGADLPASTVVVATPPDEALRLLPAQVAPRLAEALADEVPVYVACLDLALERLPSPQHPVVFDLDRPRFMSAQSEFARLTPGSGAVVHVVMQLDPREPSDAHQQRAQLEAFVDEIHPGWRDLVIENRFLPHMLAAGCLPQVAHGGAAGRLAHGSRDIANVYFAGDWVGPDGYLVDASLASARAAARLILRDRAPLVHVGASHRSSRAA